MKNKKNWTDPYISTQSDYAFTVASWHYIFRKGGGKILKAF